MGMQHNGHDSLARDIREANEVLARTDPFAALYTRFGSLVYRIALRATYDATAAEDIAQMAFIRAIPHYKPGMMSEQQEKAWLTKITMNLARDRWRSLNSHPSTSLEALTDHGFSPDDPTDYLERAEEVADASAAAPGYLDAMTPDQRKAVELRFQSDLHFSEIGDQLGMTKGSAYALVAKGLHQAREALADEDSAA